MLDPKYLIIKIEDLGIEPEEFGNNIEFMTQASQLIADNPGLIEFDTEADMFPIKLQDKHALPALLGYARSAKNDDPDLAAAVTELSERAGKNHPNCKDPD